MHGRAASGMMISLTSPLHVDGSWTAWCGKKFAKERPPHDAILPCAPLAEAFSGKF